ncbi:MAG: hypothetical protein RL238_1012 [Actinomycetota bacterium]
MAIDDVAAFTANDVRQVGGSGAAASTRTFVQRNSLKLVLVGGDLAALIVGALLASLVDGFFFDAEPWAVATTMATVAVAGLWSIRSQGLWLARNSSMRMIELTKLTRAGVVLGLVLLLADRVLKLGLHIEQAALVCVFVLGGLVVWRSVYRAWLSHERSQGRHLRATVVIGGGTEVDRLVDLLVTHRELGMEVLGLIGGSEAAPSGSAADMWLGGLDDAEALVRRSGAGGVIISPIGIAPERFNAVLRNLQRDGVHVFVATGLSGIEARRVRSMALAHEPMLYVEPPKLNRGQVVLKRCFDVVVAGVLVVLSAPLMLVCAVAVKCCDRGPVFFRQVRVGKNGRPITVTKFRTMKVDAEAHLEALTATNERSGPLFKMAADPRVTRAGRWLRESSLDELPQLFDVLRGRMSLVGPRPALPSEVVQFSPELRTRELVMPGITGLWQVEARDNPSFEAYRRLDLFYVENWSLTLDLLVVLATIEHVVVRIVTMFAGRARACASRQAA